MALGGLFLNNWISAQLNTNKKLLVCCLCDNSNHLLEYLFGVCLFSLLISLSNVLKVFQNGQFPISVYFGGHVCYHTNSKSQINTRLKHLVYHSNKLIRIML